MAETSTSIASAMGIVATAASVSSVSAVGDTTKLPHDSRQPDIIACSVLTLAMAGLCVAARFFTRMFITRTQLGASEWLVLVAWIFSFGVTIPAILQTTYGMGAHFYDLTHTFDSASVAKTELISILFYSLSLTFSKLSILVLYTLVFNYSWVRTASFVLLAVVAVSQIWMCYVIFSACTPLRAFWDASIVGATCHPQAYWLANQYQLIATDFLIFLLPLPVVWRLRVRPGQKAMLVFVFALGFFVCAISIIRIELIVPLTQRPSADFTYDNAPVYYWTDVETNLAIVVASSLTLKPLVSRLLPRRLFSLFSLPSSFGSHQQPTSPTTNSNPNAATPGMRRHPFNPIITFGSRPSRKQAPSLVDDTCALRTQHSHHSRIDSHSSTGDLAHISRRTTHSKADEEMGVGDFAVPLDTIPPPPAAHTKPS